MQIAQSLSLTAPQFRIAGSSGPSVVARHLFIVAGQSNAKGSAPDDGGPYFPADVLEYGPTDSWTPVGKRLHHGPFEDGATDASFGFARQFATDYAAANPGVGIGFIGVARSGTGFGTGQWNKGQTVYNQSVTRVNAGLAAAPAGSVLKGILWHQGENDATTAAYILAYQAALTTFIGDFRGDIPQAADLPFVLGGHAFGAGLYDRTIQSVIQAMPNVLIRTGYAPADVPRNATFADSLHFDAISQRRLGAQFVSGFAQAEANAGLGGTALITTGPVVAGPFATGISATAPGISMGTPAPGRVIVVGLQVRNTFDPYPVSASIAGVPLTRMVSPNKASTSNSTTLFYAVIPDGSQGDLSVTWSYAVTSGISVGYFVLPVYNARPHLAGPKAFNMVTGTGASLTTSIEVRAGDLIVAMSGSLHPTGPTGTINTSFTQSTVLSTNGRLTVGYEVAAVTGPRSVTCTYAASQTNVATLTVMALRPS